MSRVSNLLLYGPKYARIKFYSGSLAILYKYILYVITKVILGIYL